MSTRVMAFVFALIVSCGLPLQLNAGVIPVTSFGQIQNSLIFDDPGGPNGPSEITVGGITLSPSVAHIPGGGAVVFAGFIHPGIPGDGRGWDEQGTVTLTLSRPVAAFGVTFFHLEPSQFTPDLSAPAILELFDGPDGSGTLLGSITDSGVTGGQIFQVNNYRLEGGSFG